MRLITFFALRIKAHKPGRRQKIINTVPVEQEFAVFRIQSLVLNAVQLAFKPEILCRQLGNKAQRRFAFKHIVHTPAPLRRHQFQRTDTQSECA